VEPDHAGTRHSVHLIARAQSESINSKHGKAPLRQGRFAPLLAPGIVKTAPSSSSRRLLGRARRADMLFLSHLFFRQTPRRVDRCSCDLQLFSSAAYSCGHEQATTRMKTLGHHLAVADANGVTTKDVHPPAMVVMS